MQLHADLQISCDLGLFFFSYFAAVSVSGCRWTAESWTMTFQRRPFPSPSASWSGINPSFHANLSIKGHLSVESILQLVMVLVGFAASLLQSVAVSLITSALILCRFYVENITHLKDIITIELFFLNAKSAVYNVSIICVGKAGTRICSDVYLCRRAPPDDSPSLDPNSMSAQQTACRASVSHIKKTVLGNRGGA